MKYQIGGILKNIAYKIGTDNIIQAQGYALPNDVIKALMRKDVPLDDNKYAYIYGTKDRYPEMTNPKGFDYSNYIKRNNYKGVKNVYGIINPLGYYSLDENYRPLVEELSKHGYHFYDNANDINGDTDKYYDDVGNFIHKMDLDENGNPIIHDSDIYDFNSDDYNYDGNNSIPKGIGKTEASLMDLVGTPYIIRDENNPIYFNGISNNAYGIQSHLDNLTGKDIARITNTGYIRPAIVVAKQNKFHVGK